MNINFSWVDRDINHKDQLKKYCSTESEVNFCWWISGDIASSTWCYDQILELLNNPFENNETKWQWRGNSYWISIQKDNKVILFQPIDNEEYIFDLNEFKNALVEYYSTSKKLGVTFF